MIAATLALMYAAGMGVGLWLTRRRKHHSGVRALEPLVQTSRQLLDATRQELSDNR